ncbi:MAG: molecular chaperone HtpG [Bacteroidetes bacterium]|nr:molecular chaperone HtpG [Bacteroidota bacterium]
MQKGNISVHTENLFPIIKKFLYSDHEIFLRELISNAVDASQKLNVLASKGELEGEIGDLKIKVIIDEKAKTITISDRGIGMTEEEIEKYINQIAFSGAEEFVNKYKDTTDAQIIGHFGLGFYSSFMVANTVEIKSLSYKKGEKSAYWKCTGNTEFELGAGKKKDRGTDIILHIAEDSTEFLQKWKINELLTKYCKFLPIEIEFDGKVINNTNPIWKKSPSEITDEEYIKFYNELHPFQESPLFWIHINVDYPFNLTGILYFPKTRKEIELSKDRIKLYSNQVFVTEHVQEIVPEYLMLLQGIIDSPDIPLNVSRSALQADSNVKKITSHISKKVADKLHELYKKDAKDFENKWDSMSLFVKYGIISDEKFDERAKAFCLLKNTKNKYYTIEAYLNKISVNQTDKDNNKVALYTTDQNKQFSFIEPLEAKGYDILLFNEPIDNHFIMHLEQKNEKLQIKRVDSASADKIIDKGQVFDTVLSDEEKKILTELMENQFDKEKFKVELQSLSPDEQFISITKNEFDRRMREMNQMGGGMYSFMANMPEKYDVIVNTNHTSMLNLVKEKDNHKQNTNARRLADLALLAQNMLHGEALSNFIKRSAELA